MVVTRRVSTFLLLLACMPFCYGAEGMHLYQQHCAVCHGSDGERKAWNVTERIAGWPSDAVKKALTGYKEKNRDRYGYGAYMHPQINRYSYEQIELIAGYVATLRQPSQDALAHNGQ